MAETEERSLDDFFAKRDKKKRKEKSSRGTAAATVSLAASSNAAAGGVGGSRQTEGGSGAAAGANTVAAKVANKEEDDWKEFEQEEVDYSGLRVQSMQISEKDDDEGEKREEPRDYSEEPGGGVDKSSGPWNRSATTQNPVVETVENPEPVQSSGVYRPPGARETRTRKAPQGPPEIYSDTQFPSLQSTAKHVDTRKY
ncbi:protein CDV3 homolog isoform X2 [Heteronotia binoei]|uniref:protein CDV3 homolog isoform X2 n=1 Tax=Heteronotia binoei TaxID=13085 RepID=UPI00292CAA6B|nr:protein CDV3 homolog isoform X2 [Heteronotia binoei]